MKSSIQLEHANPTLNKLMVHSEQLYKMLGMKLTFILSEIFVFDYVHLFPLPHITNCL